MLDAVADRSTAPGGGPAACVVAALAAALTAMAARFADDEPTATAADTLVTRLADLADADIAAYGAYAAARRARSGDVQAALDRAVDVPLQVAAAAAEISRLADRLVREGNPRLRGDAATAAELALAAARACAHLVDENLASSPDDPRRRQAWDYASSAAPPPAGLPAE